MFLEVQHMHAMQQEVKDGGIRLQEEGTDMEI